MRLAINALRAKSGGAKSHLKGIISNIDPKIHGFEKVYIWIGIPCEVGSSCLHIIVKSSFVIGCDFKYSST